MKEKVCDSNEPCKGESFQKGVSPDNKSKKRVRVRSDERYFKCNFCGKVLTSKTGLTLHVRIHTGEKVFECDICKKTFSQRCHLETHFRIHTGEKPYECSVCQRKFSHGKSLKTHMRLHTGEKPYECSVCEKKFTQEIHLKHHMRTHTGENLCECSVCKKKFLRRSDLNCHMKIHTGEKPYKCSFCNKKSSKKSDLKRHMKVHARKKPYELVEVVMQPSGSLDRSRDTRMKCSSESDVLCISKEIPDSYNKDNRSNYRKKSQGGETHLEESLSVVDHAVLYNSGAGSSCVTGSDVRRTCDRYSLKRRERFSQVVKNVIDNNTDSQIETETNVLACSMQKQQQQQQQQQSYGNKEPECRKMKLLKYNNLDPSKDNKVDGFIDKVKSENDHSNVILADKTTFRSDDQVFDIHRVFVVDPKSSESPDDDEDRSDLQCHLPNSTLVTCKREKDESLYPLIIKEEPNAS